MVGEFCDRRPGEVMINELAERHEHVSMDVVRNVDIPVYGRADKTRGGEGAAVCCYPGHTDC